MRKTVTTIIAASLASGALAGEPVEVTAPGPEGELAGTLIPPAKGQPVILIYPGSGPTDRDGNNPLGVTAASYRMLAEAMAQSGIGSLRVDKRGMFGSSTAVADRNAVTIADYARDVGAWVEVARAQTGAPCVWVLGHSEGGLVALEAAQRPEGMCGVLLVASVGRPLGDTIREQLRSNPANAFLLDEAMAALDSLEAGERVDTEGMNPALLGLFAPGVQGFLIDLLAKDPAALASRVELPMLIVAGGRDIQTPVADAEALAARQAKAKLVIIDSMNHVLKRVEGDGRGPNLATYSDPDLPIHPDLVTTIEQFVTGLRD